IAIDTRARVGVRVREPTPRTPPAATAPTRSYPAVPPPGREGRGGAASRAEGRGGRGSPAHPRSFSGGRAGSPTPAVQRNHVPPHAAPTPAISPAYTRIPSHRLR